MERGRMTKLSARMNSGAQMSECLGKVDVSDQASVAVSGSASTKSSSCKSVAPRMRSPYADYEEDGGVGAGCQSKRHRVQSTPESCGRRNEWLAIGTYTNPLRPRLFGDVARMVADEQKSSDGIPWRQIPGDHTLATPPYKLGSPRGARLHPQLPKDPQYNKRFELSFPPRQNAQNSPASVHHWYSFAAKEALSEALPKLDEEKSYNSPVAASMPVPAADLKYKRGPRIGPFPVNKSAEEKPQPGQITPHKRRDFVFNCVKPEVRLTRTTSVSAPISQGMLGSTMLSKGGGAKSMSTWLVCSTPRLKTLDADFAHSMVAQPDPRQRSYIRWKY